MVKDPAVERLQKQVTFLAGRLAKTDPAAGEIEQLAMATAAAIDPGLQEAVDRLVEVTGNLSKALEPLTDLITKTGELNTSVTALLEKRENGGEPAAGGESKPAEGAGEGKPAEGAGEGKPAEGAGEGKPAEGAGEGKPAAGGAPAAGGEGDAAAAGAAGGEPTQKSTGGEEIELDLDMDALGAALLTKIAPGIQDLVRKTIDDAATGPSHLRIVAGAGGGGERVDLSKGGSGSFASTMGISGD